jgi:protocatechuate 3,4-dioxygenase, beta subunit
MAMNYLFILLIAISFSSVAQQSLDSGLPIGSNAPAFDPKHVSGADKGKMACPMCKYGYGTGLMVWLNTTDVEKFNHFVKKMENEIKKRGEKKLRVFVVYMNPGKANPADIEKKLRQWTNDQDLEKVAVTYVPSPVDEETCQVYDINSSPKIINTVFLYHKRTIIDKYINMVFTDKDISVILEKLQVAAAWKDS